MTEKRTRRTRAGMTGSRVNAVINTILLEMEHGLRTPGYVEKEGWKALFGSKDSVVVNVQKLIAAMADLAQLEAGQTKVKSSNPEGAPLTQEEMQLLTEWLADRKES